MKQILVSAVFSALAILLIPSQLRPDESAPASPEDTVLWIEDAGPETHWKETVSEPETAGLETVRLLDGGTVQLLPMDDYLTCVVLSEMPPEFESEALKAQAVAARTFTEKRRLSAKHENADVCSDSACCQAWQSEAALREKFGADFAYTVDGGALEEVNFETFNAAAAHWDVTGFNIHPGDAKNTMINASLVACEINAMLPAGDTPAHTEGYEGFYHLMSMTGTVERAELDYIVRDHSAASFAARETTLRHIEKLINEKYGAGTAKLTLTEQYRNMAECMSDHMDIVERAERAIAAAGLKPVRVPVRGGTDGAQLSFRGLPCPNLGTGGYSFHGPYEHITAEAMDTAVEIILGIVGKK